MKTLFLLATLLLGGTAIAAAHSSVQDHAHPHTDAASYFTVETLIIFAIGLSIGGTVAWARRRRGK